MSVYDERLRSLLSLLNTNNYILPRTNIFQGEYIAPHEEQVAFLTGFTGSNGWFCIKGQEMALFTDSRYLLQAQKELPPSVKVYDLATYSIANWYLDDASLTPIFYDPTLLSVATYKNFIKLGLGLVSQPQDLVKDLWGVCAPVPRAFYEYPLAYSGQSSVDKKRIVLTKLPTQASALWISNPESICWLLNIRSDATAFTPLVHGHALLEKDETVTLFTNHPRPKDFNCDKLTVKPWDEAYTTFINYPKNLHLDIKTLPMSFFLNRTHPQDIFAHNLIEDLKAIKNPIEIEQAIKTHEKDGLALTQFILWLKEEFAHNKSIDELQASDKLLEFRKKQEGFVCPSFETISASGENGAIVHYRSTPKTNRPLKEGELYLLDSGGQYLGGTTDVTRTLCLKSPTQEQKEYYTLVLKGHIALASARFPKGTRGSHLDVLARQYLWEIGKDYGHGTGHGVGNFLSVHEGPQRISRTTNDAVLVPGMILSNEPGFYKEGSFGIRLENLIYVKECEDGFLCFETLTLAPFEEELIVDEWLTQKEKTWLSIYNSRIEKLLEASLVSPLLQKDKP